MKKIRLTGILCVLTATMALGARIPENFTLHAEWPEQKIKDNTVHKHRVPRGGTFDVVATIDSVADRIWRFDDGRKKESGWQRPRGGPGRCDMEIAADPGIEPFEILINGQKHPLDSAISVDRIKQKHEIRWRYRFDWIPRKAEPFHDFTVSATPPRRDQFPVFRKSIRVEQGVSCYTTTMLDRIKEMAESKYFKYEVMGKTYYGKDMYLIRVADFSVPAKKKKQMLMCGPIDGEEPTGLESVLDFAWEMITLPENREYLKKIAFYIFPSDNPDGHEMAIRARYGYPGKMDVIESNAFELSVDKYENEYTDAIGVVNHQWPRDWTLLSVVAPKSDKPDTLPFVKLGRNVTLALMNDTDEPIWPIYAPFRGSYHYNVKGIPNIIIEAPGLRDFNLGTTMPNIVREMKIYYLMMQQHLNPTVVRPKTRPARQVVFSDSQNYHVRMVKKPPKMDGLLRESFWRRKTVVSRFGNKDWSRRLKGKGVGTEIRMVYDKQNLYIGGKVPGFAPLDTVAWTPGTWGRRDFVQLLFDTNLNGWSHYQIAVFADSVLEEAYFAAGGVEDQDSFRLKDYDLKISLKKGTFELKVPFASLNDNSEMSDEAISSPPKPGTVWGFNVIRNKNSGRARFSWSPSEGYRGHSPHLFWGMTFTGTGKTDVSMVDR